MRLNSPLPDVSVKKELVKQNMSKSIIDPKVQIILEVDKNIINDTYGNNTKQPFTMTNASNIAKRSDLRSRDRKKLHNMVFQPIEVNFNETHTTESPSKSGIQTGVINQQDNT
ncbi:hypothetical protein RclHR1_08640007 [Rhizophagus clarus]|uniref:Uncharacterized protein n=1 Tax=Rhizophagus clarus TaxID=94130 RepID=A0A2Z6SCF1_9GLOM|nr:hypothetical protein RclHR1_08640007 [Rhizophagus clarus]